MVCFILYNLKKFLMLSEWTYYSINDLLTFTLLDMFVFQNHFSDQGLHPPSLIRVFAVCSVGS